ncbi:hypothetical protein H8E88_01835 [candidate division KSB1 bacterium]|nr:hypothetical protein [candidate division KSB1 bacterium]
MNKTITKSQNYIIPEAINKFYSEMQMSPEYILKGYAISAIYSKIDKYKSESNLFERKYKCDYHQFKNRIEAMENKENFKWEDDLMDWQFAVENINYWQFKLKEIEAE